MKNIFIAILLLPVVAFKNADDHDTEYAGYLWKYPSYFAQAKKAHQDSTDKKEKLTDHFATEKWFTLGTQITPLLNFKKGDVLKIHTATGLWHYRNKKLLNQYKIVPQLATITQRIVCARAPCPPVVTNKLVYFLGASERFIDIRFNGLLVSETKQKDANSPNKALQTKWIKAYDIKSQANK
ncbi:MAG: hypothetical protein EOP53_07130 [Sphingobacteriales bacterium]|nr:MAG: hypothetical protein EOP53_07130 [Sphingobacteriales bacterium]